MEDSFNRRSITRDKILSKADLLKQKFRFKKSLGQNIFIGNTQNLLNLTNFMDDDFIIEVGTGTGDITKEIAKRVEFVRSYEIDERLKEFINENIIFYKNIEVKYMDFLLEDKFPESFKFFSNLPYSQAAEILKKCSMINSLKEGYFMIQKELGERIISKEGSKKYGAISIFLQTFFSFKSMKEFNKDLFYPKPKVDSIFIYFKRIREWDDEFEQYESFLKDIFSKRRKKIKKYLSDYLNDMNIDTNLRPEDIKVEDYIKIYENFIRSKDKSHS